MAQKAGGADQLASARELLRTAKTADELRAVQAVALPLELGLSLEQTVKAICRSVGAMCNLRTRYCKVARREREAPRPKRALRKAPVFVEQTDPQADDVFSRKKFKFGAEARAAAGYGFWQMAYGSTGEG